MRYYPRGGAKRILIVDDDAANRNLMEALLRPQGYIIDKAECGLDCLAKVQEVPPDLIVLDIIMPDLDGIEVCRRLKANLRTMDIPIVFVTGLDDRAARIRGKEAGGDDFLTKPIDLTELIARTKNLLRLKEYHDEIKQHRDALEEKVRERTAELYAAHEETLLRLSMAAEYKDTDTGAHLLRISGYAEILARALNMDGREVNLVRQASVTHDIGKIGIPEAILAKPAKLTREEFTVIQTHPVIGARILAGSQSDLLQMSERVAERHHEKWNGTGYPDGLAGDAIPIEARIVAVADVFDALTTKRVYKPAFPVEQAVQTIEDESGEHFDPVVVDAFLESLEQIVELHNKLNHGDVEANSYILRNMRAAASGA